MATLVKRALAAFHTSRFPQWTSNPYFCPALTGHELFGDLAKHGTTVYISAGASEMLLDEIVLLRDSMRNRGMDVTYREVSFTLAKLQSVLKCRSLTVLIVDLPSTKERTELHLRPLGV